MASRFVLTPQSADFRVTNPASLIALDPSASRRMALEFSKATEQAADWTFVAPADLTTPIEIELFYIFASATSGTSIWGALVEAVTPDTDALNLNTTTSLDTENGGTDAAVPGTLGNLASLTIALTNNDSIAAGDLVRVRIVMKTTGTATGNAYLIAAELRDDA